MIKFKKRKKITDSRSLLINAICDLIVDKYQFIDLAVKSGELDLIYKYSDEVIENLYELVEEEIPLFNLYELYEYGADNKHDSQKEYEKEIEITLKACDEYY